MEESRSSGASSLWHRELDVISPRAAAEFLASRIPSCKVTIWPDEGPIGIARIGTTSSTRWPQRLADGLEEGAGAGFVLPVGDGSHRLAAVAAKRAVEGGEPLVAPDEVVVQDVPAEALHVRIAEPEGRV